MPQPNSPRLQFHFGLRGWAAIGMGLVALAAVTVLALGLLVFLLPVMVLASVLYYFAPRRPKMTARRDGDIIDGEFQVVERNDDRTKAITDTHDP